MQCTIICFFKEKEKKDANAKLNVATQVSIFLYSFFICATVCVVAYDVYKWCKLRRYLSEV